MRRRAFTLIEVLLAIALVSLLLASAAGMLVGLSRDRQDVERRVATISGAMGVLERLETDLGCAVVDARGLGAGVAGAGESIDVVTRIADAGADTRRSRYTFDAARGEVMLERAGGRSAARRDVVARGVEAVAFRYHDGRAWVESFDSARLGRLPLAVQVSLWMKTPLGPSPAWDLARDGERASPRGATGEDSERGSRPTRAPDVCQVIAVPDARARGGGA